MPFCVKSKIIFAHLSSLITSTKWASLFSLKFLARRWIRAEWSIPVPAVPVPPARPKLVPVPVLVLVFLSFSWRISHRELWLALTWSSAGGLRRPLAALCLWPGMSWMDVKTETHLKIQRRVIRKTQVPMLGVSEKCMLYPGVVGLILFLAAVEHSNDITRFCSWLAHTVGNTGRLKKEQDNKIKHRTQLLNQHKHHRVKL